MKKLLLPLLTSFLCQTALSQPAINIKVIVLDPVAFELNANQGQLELTNDTGMQETVNILVNQGTIGVHADGNDTQVQILTPENSRLLGHFALKPNQSLTLDYDYAQTGPASGSYQIVLKDKPPVPPYQGA